MNLRASKGRDTQLRFLSFLMMAHSLLYLQFPTPPFAMLLGYPKLPPHIFVIPSLHLPLPSVLLSTSPRSLCCSQPHTSFHVQGLLGSSPTALCPSSQSLVSLCSACCHYGNLCEDVWRDEDALWDVVTTVAFCSEISNSIRTEAAWEREMGVTIFLLMAI